MSLATLLFIASLLILLGSTSVPFAYACDFLAAIDIP